MRHRASIVLIKNGTILLVRRENEKGRYYVFPGGIEAGETAEQAAVREAAEEAGIILTADGILCICENDFDRNTLVVCHQVDGKEPAWLESHKQQDNNTYAFEWVPLSRLSGANLLPTEGKDAVIAKYV